MNTRLQVEHPVTELVTGIDLVEQMIRSAAGEKLSLKQSDVKLNGWAVESRVYAEDPYRNFLPSTGRLTRYRPPQEHSANGVTLRNDTGVYEGGEISIYYDPMIAKLVTHAPTREQAIDAQADALDAFVIDGIRHNIPFLLRADGASALARRQTVDRLHRRGISRRLSSASRPRASAREVLARSPRRSIMCWASASAGFPGSWTAAWSQRESQRACWLGDKEYRRRGRKRRERHHRFGDAFRAKRCPKAQRSR